MARWIDKLPFGVHGCSAFPQMGTDPDGFWDLQTDNDVTRTSDFTAISATAVKEFASKLGWVGPEVLEEALEENHRLRLEIQALQDELNEAEGFMAAVDVMESRGFTARKKPGRPKKVEA